MKIHHCFILCWFLLVGSVQADSDIQKFLADKEINPGYFELLVGKQGGKVYLKVDKFNQPLLFQSGLPYGLGSNDIGLDRGQLGDTRIVQFERYGDKVLLKQLNTYYRANSSNLSERQAINEAFASSILWGFKVEAEDSNSVYINYTPFLLSDIHHVAEKLKNQKQGSFQLDQSRSALFAKRTKSFPNNTELEAIVTYKGVGTGQYVRSVTPDNHAITLHLHHSLVKLPDDQYQIRPFHPQSGFWSIEYADYATAIEQPLLQRVIPRHRLYKKHPKAKMSEAVKPITYYLDSGVPEPIRSALMEGASWWNQAFTAIGYKNAFQVKLLPKDADPMDVRYNVIQWVHRATRGWSYGASVIDPRTGEIIKGHVTLGSLRVRQDYLLAQALTSPFINSHVDTSRLKEMALARIRQLAAHEVGHTLGIAHNFAASTHNRASVMDYPHPTLTLTKQGVDLSNAYAVGIGAWDKQVIAYGYRDFTNNEKQGLAQVLAQSKQLGLRFLSDADARPQSGASINAHLWDNGADPIAELENLNRIRAYALQHFGKNSIAEGTPYSELEQVLVPLYNLTRFQIEAVSKLIAGVDYQYSVKQNNSGIAMHTASAKLQQQALSALLSTLQPEYLTLPEHISQLIPPKAYGYSRNRESFPAKTGLTFDAITGAEALAQKTVSLILNPQRLARLAQQHAINSRILSVTEVFKKLLAATIENSAARNQQALVQQRVNQVVVNQLLKLWQNANLVAEVRADLYHQLNSTLTWLENHSKGRYRKSAMAKQYLWLAQQIRQQLNNDDMITPNNNIEMPPGSPIGGE